MDFLEIPCGSRSVDKYTEFKDVCWLVNVYRDIRHSVGSWLQYLYDSTHTVHLGLITGQYLWGFYFAIILRLIETLI